MKKILITGATGNVGVEVIRALHNINHPFAIVAGVRDPEKENKKPGGNKVSWIKFDFTDIHSYAFALTGINMLFLLRPPQISDADKYFKPLISIAKNAGVEHIVFLSVQGVESSRLIPHHKIEKLIVDSTIPYTFLRPAYFMQNFSTTLHADLADKKRIFLPAGNARFTLIDVRDIGAVAAKVFTGIAAHLNKAYDLTSNEKLTFGEMAAQLSVGLGIKIQYQSPGLLNFYRTKRKEGMPRMFILVMIMLHFFPRFQQAPAISNWVEKITGRRPVAFDQFIIDYRQSLLQTGKR